MPWSRENRAGFDLAGDEGDYDGGNDTMFDNNRGGRGPGRPGRDREGFGFGFGRGPGRGERPLEQGDLRWLVLDLIAAQPRHGYEIIKAIEEMLNGHYTPSPGVIYPTLTFLEETGQIAGEAQGAKKLYTVTDEGRAALEANAAEIQAVRDRLAAARGRFGGPPAPEMMRAMGNLRAALQVRLAKGELTSESLAAITAALDRAAGEIERS
jgi:DNA-binding PadR family transcriptional regulator